MCKIGNCSDPQIVMETDLIGTPAEHSVSQIEPADRNVLEKLN